MQKNPSGMEQEQQYLDVWLSGSKTLKWSCNCLSKGFDLRAGCT